MPESTELNSNLADVFSACLASSLNINVEQAPKIVTAYRVGPATVIKPNYPRIILQFTLAKDREAVL